jgi:hypothetical protein
VSIVTHPAYEQTTVGTREANEAIDKAIEEQLKRECGDKNDKRDDDHNDPDDKDETDEEREAREQKEREEQERKEQEEREALNKAQKQRSALLIAKRKRIEDEII